MFHNLFSYINDNKLKLTYLNNKIDLLNYKRILIFTNDKIKIDCFTKFITIKGSNLTITKLYDEELLVEGVITSILFEDLND